MSLPAACSMTCLVLYTFGGMAGQKIPNDPLPGLTNFCAAVAGAAGLAFPICLIWLIWS